MTASDAAKELRRRRAAREELQWFILYLDPDYIVSDFSREVCAALDKFLADMVSGLRPVLILQAPPQHGKSQIVSRYLPAFILGKYPKWSIGGLSYGKSLADDMNRDVQRIMGQDEYGRLFPASKLGAAGTRQNTETFELPQGGRYLSQGVGGPLTGKKLDIGIIDDPIKNSQEALSQTVKDSVWNWYGTTFGSRMAKNSGQIIMATSWALDDLAGRVGQSISRAAILKFPAISLEGEALIPELHPIEQLLEIKETMTSYFWSALYQQSPTVLGGQIIKGEWFGRYFVAPVIEHRCIYADTAMKTGEANDYSVFQLWGKGEDGKIYLLDMSRGKWEAPELERRAQTFWAKHQVEDIPRWGQLRQMKVEDKASGTGLIQKIKSMAQIPIAGIERVKDKYSRLMDVLGYIEAGMVCIPENSSFVNDFVAECEAVTANDTHAHDDQIDPMIDAINDMLGRSVATLWERMG